MEPDHKQVLHSNNVTRSIMISVLDGQQKNIINKYRLSYYILLKRS